MAVTRPFESLLIANRGEIAVRIARSCRVLGVRSIAIYSDADAGALHVKSCDDAVAIGGTSARDSYLRGDRIIAAAQTSRAIAIHPGYGFLSESADFAQACRDAGLTFVGPLPAAMRAVGDKIAAKQTAIAAGVPVLPGFLERVQSHDVLQAEAGRIGTPLLIKAAAGGGGRGMRLVTALSELDVAIEAAQREAQSAFGDATVFLERFVESPRHIEVQIIADAHGTCIALGERECSIQRRYQKILEESPSPAVDAALRAKLEDAAVTIARAVGYTNAGTVEFMLDRNGDFYFLEMNARLQVEHPVTEMVTGVDLVAEQLAVAAGHRLNPKRQPPRGHAMEVRVYAEDPARGFLPSTGRITTFVLPQLPGVRNDVAVEAGSEVSAAYDPMLAKLIVHSETRAETLNVIARALGGYLVGGVATNLGFLRWLVDQPAIKQGITTTDFLDRHFRPELVALPVGDALAAMAAAGASAEVAPSTFAPVGSKEPTPHSPGVDPWQSLGSWRHSFAPQEIRFASLDAPVSVRRVYREDAWHISFGNHRATVRSSGGGAFTIDSDQGAERFAAWWSADGISINLRGAMAKFASTKPPSDAALAGQRHGGEAVRGSVEAPMSGTIVKVNVKPGETVAALAILLVMEAMKMEHAIAAPYPGSVTAVKARVGQSVSAGEVLIEMAEA